MTRRLLSYNPLAPELPQLNEHLTKTPNPLSISEEELRLKSYKNLLHLVEHSRAEGPILEITRYLKEREDHRILSKALELNSFVLNPQLREILERYRRVCQEALSNNVIRPPVLILSGPSGYGKWTLVRSLARDFQLPLCEYPVSYTDEEFYIVRDSSLVEKALYQGARFIAVIVEDIVVNADHDRDRYRWKVFDHSSVTFDNIVLRIDRSAYLPVSTQLLESIAQQEGHTLSLDELKRVSLEFARIDFEMSPHNITYALRRAQQRHENLARSISFSDSLLMVLSEMASWREKTAQSALIKTPKRSLEDLIVDQATLRSIKRIIAAAQLANGDRRHEFLRRHHDSQGVRVLFYGEPGTGKTLCAEAIARELNRPLWVSNFAEIKSSLVGESEKSLYDLFQRAEACSAVLLFDEADALLMSREGQSQAHERSFTNLLLQLLGDFRNGLLILASNYIKDLDHALARRVDYKIEFKRPTHQLIARMLEQKLQPDFPAAEPLDHLALTQGLPLTGGLLANFIEQIAGFLAEVPERTFTNAEIRDILEEIVREHARISRQKSLVGFGAI